MEDFDLKHGHCFVYDLDGNFKRIDRINPKVRRIFRKKGSQTWKENTFTRRRRIPEQGIDLDTDLI